MTILAKSTHCHCHFPTISALGMKDLIIQPNHSELLNWLCFHASKQHYDFGQEMPHCLLPAPEPQGLSWLD